MVYFTLTYFSSILRPILKGAIPTRAHKVPSSSKYSRSIVSCGGFECSWNRGGWAEAILHGAALASLASERSLIVLLRSGVLWSDMVPQYYYTPGYLPLSTGPARLVVKLLLKIHCCYSQNLILLAGYGWDATLTCQITAYQVQYRL